MQNLPEIEEFPSLDHWHSTLHTHFLALANKRRASQATLFAMEHPLTLEEMPRIFSLLKKQLPRLDPKYWLLWVIYAAEQGYNYDGGEYWITFEQRTPNWDWSYRNTVRRWFIRFAETYAGFKPAGPWAQHFTIICWPITHSILPKDMHQQMVNAVYSVRHQINSEALKDPLRVGRLIAGAVTHATARFKRFLEQEELVGRIAIALLDNKTTLSEDLIFDSSLGRIVNDLSSMVGLKQKLQESQRIIQLSQMSGTAKIHAHPHIERKSYFETKQTLYDLKPQISLFLTNHGAWKPAIELPPLSDYLKDKPELSEFLRNTRCSVYGVEGKKPRGWLFSRVGKQEISNWPNPDNPLIKFEQSAPIGDVFANEIKTPSGNLNLFRTNADGTAREIRTKIVSPNQKYIIVHKDPLPNFEVFTPITIECANMRATQFVTPSILSSDLIEKLHQIGLSVRGAISIAPAGIAARSWDGVGGSDWLTSEPIMLSIKREIPVTLYQIILDNGIPQSIQAHADGRPNFFELLHVPAGGHTLIIHAYNQANAVPVASGALMLTVREPEPSISSSSGHTGLTVLMDPLETDLDTFWAGKTNVLVYGPVGRTVNFSLAFLRADGEELWCKDLGEHALPITSEHWKRILQSKGDTETEEDAAYLNACSAALIIDGGELGVHKTPIYREPSPLRWFWLSKQKYQAICLSDDFDDESQLKTYFYSFTAPDKRQEIKVEECLKGLKLESPGGLFVAEKSGNTAKLVVSVFQTAHSFSDLIGESSWSVPLNSEQSLHSLASLLGLWSDASLAGPMAITKRVKTLDRIAGRIIQSICGDQWANQERYAERLSDPRSAITSNMQKLVDRKPGFAAVLNKNFREIFSATADAAVDKFHNYATRYEICEDINACNLALRLASNPYELRKLPKEILEQYLENVSQYPSLLRGARFIVLLANANSIELPKWGSYGH